MLPDFTTTKIVYASQTGNAQDVAERIGRKLKCMGVPVVVTNIADYKILYLSRESLVIFVCSTTGQGNYPDDMEKNWKFLLRKNLVEDGLKDVNFGVIGLGDSSYDRYNVVAKRLYKRLMQLKAKPCFPILLCDDQHDLGYDGAFEPWLKDFLANVLPTFHPAVKDFSGNADRLLPAKYKIKFMEKKHKMKMVVEDEEVVKVAEREELPYTAKVKCNRRVTKEDHFQDVRLIEFRIDDEVTYRPGDVAVLMPKNDPQAVADFCRLVRTNLDKEFTLEATDPQTVLPKHLPTPCTLRRCILSYWDIQSVPRRSFFELLRHFSINVTEREKLLDFTTAEGQEELYSYCNRPRRNIIEVLQDFPNTTPYIPVDYWFDLIPRIKPRLFSIASSLRYHPKEFHLLVAVVNYKTKLYKPRKGLCSNWLSRLTGGTKVKFNIKSGSIALTMNDRPIVLIGPGTGCSPFRGFIEERQLNGMKDNYLFFGNRFKCKDFLCEKDWLLFVEKGFLKLFTAFSRDQNDKVYVQHKILENRSLLWDLIDKQNAYFYIAGNAKNMPQDVKDALSQVIKTEGNRTDAECEVYMHNLNAQKRLRIETWS